MLRCLMKKIIKEKSPSMSDCLTLSLSHCRCCRVVTVSLNTCIRCCESCECCVCVGVLVWVVWVGSAVPQFPQLNKNANLSRGPCVWCGKMNVECVAEAKYLHMLLLAAVAADGNIHTRTHTHIRAPGEWHAETHLRNDTQCVNVF